VSIHITFGDCILLLREIHFKDGGQNLSS